MKVIVYAGALSLEAFGKVKGAKKSVLRNAILSYVGASLALLRLQESYLGSDHCDLSTTHSDIEEGLRCALHHFYASGTPALATTTAPATAPATAKASTTPDFSMTGLLNKLAAPPYYLPIPPSAGKEYLETLMAHSSREARRLKRLYNTELRYSGPAKLTQPGDVWWGGFEAER